MLRAMEEPEVVGLASIRSLPLLFSLPLLDFDPSLSPSMTREEKLVGASRTRGVLGRERVRSKAVSSMESTPESFEPLAVRGFDLGRSDNERWCFCDIPGVRKNAAADKKCGNRSKKNAATDQKNEKFYLMQTWGWAWVDLPLLLQVTGRTKNKTKYKN